MTQIPVRIKVRCVSCRASFRLSQEEYRELVKRSRVALACPKCGNGFEYTPVAAVEEAMPPIRSRPHRQEAEVVSEPVPASPMAPPQAAPVAVPEFPPPPFAPLTAGTPAPTNAAPPHFAPLAGRASTPTPAASFPQGTSAATKGEAKKLTLNDRWKKLPPWVQWTVIGVLIVVLGIIIFAMPTGGGSGTAEKEKPAQKSEIRSQKSEIRNQR